MQSLRPKASVLRNQTCLPVWWQTSSTCWFWVKILSIFCHILGRKRAFTFCFLIRRLNSLKRLPTWRSKWCWSLALWVISILDACHRCTCLLRAWLPVESELKTLNCFVWAKIGTLEGRWLSKSCFCFLTKTEKSLSYLPRVMGSAPCFRQVLYIIALSFPKAT